MPSTKIRTGRSASRRAVVSLAALAYLPLILSQRGRLPADTKLGLTLDPVRLMSDAMRSWDTGQFGGWVPHQSISYLWPSGPFHALLLWLGTPEWLTQRLWAGTVLFAAGAGVWWFIRRRGYSPTAAFVAAVLYQTSPYILSYISRTSLMLMPWAALGWLLALTDRAIESDRDWKRPTAVFGLVVGTAMGINLTAAAMVAPAPLIVLVLHVVERRATWRHAATTLVRLGAASVITSVWWMVMLLMQGRYGAEVLGYSETLEAVSSTSSAPEVLRGLGYWLNYIHAPSGVTTSAATPYMIAPTQIAVGAVLLVVSLSAIVIVRFRERALAGVLLLVGVLLAVGVHPIDDASPLMSGLAGATRSSLALAFRSSTRAIPLVLLAFALCVAALIDAASRTNLRLRVFVAPAVGLLAVLNLPALFNGALVDPELLHDQRPPAEWYAAATVLDSQSSETRVLQLPGVESQVFTWGYTVDPPLAMLTDRPLITRDWLPLGAPAVMDLLYAFDDRFQNGTIDPNAVAPISRLLSVGTVWLALDANADRFASARPEAVAAVLDVAPDVRRTSVDGARVRLYEIDRPNSIARAATRSVVLFGSGDGIVDAAAAGLLDGTEAIFFASDLSDAQLSELAAEGAEFILTDSNRDRARQWRGSQDVWGLTEIGGPDADVLVLDPQDNRLPVFTHERGDEFDNQTIASLSDGLVVQASHYGSSVALLPEFRPALAVDGDPRTAWVVGLDNSPIIGETIRLSSAPDGLLLRQVDGGHDITSIAVESGVQRTVFTLDERSHSDAGQMVPVAGDGPVTVTILALTLDEGALAAHPLTVGAGFSEMLPSAHVETVRTPSLRGALEAESPVSVVLTRLRTEKPDRLDVEPVLRRSFSTPSMTSTAWRVQVRAHGRTTTTQVATGCRSDLLVVDGEQIPLQIDGAAATALSSGAPAWLEPCSGSPALASGAHRLEANEGRNSGIDVDVVTIAPEPTADPGHALAAPTVTIERHVDDHTLHVSNCPDGCWVLFSEGYSPGWSATSDDAAVGEHRSVSGGFNGWWIEPTATDGTATMRIHWAAQRPVMFAAAFSALGAVVLGGLALRRRPILPHHTIAEGFHVAFRRRDPHAGGGWRACVVSGVVSVIVTSLAISPRWALYVIPLLLLSVATRRRWLYEATGLALVGVSAVTVVVLQRLRRYPAYFGWPSRFPDLHRPVLLGVVLLAVGASSALLRSRNDTDD